MADQTIAPYQNKNVNITVKGFILGALAIQLLQFVTMMIFAVLCVPLLFPLAKVKQLIESHYSSQITPQAAAAVSDIDYIRVTAILTLLAVSFSSGIIQFTLWGARSFLRDETRNILMFSAVWIIWDIFWYGSFSLYDYDVSIPAILGVALALSRTRRILKRSSASL